jgi:8-oxo-dGTP pyrophosphatase MutT (NUDIX family)
VSGQPRPNVRDAIVPARPAATVVVVREATGQPGAGDGIEILVLRRSATSRFAPGFVVFPGGAVEEGDRVRARDWFRAPNEAARACAIRELAEETGLLLTAHGLDPTGSIDDGAFEPPSIERLPEVARWIAPEFLPVRFDACFFAVEAGAGLEPRPDGVEADLAWWASPQQILEDQRAGRAQLMWPTFKTLEALSACTTIREVLALRIEQAPPPSPPQTEATP